MQKMFPSTGRLRILYQIIFTEEKPILILALEGSSKMLWSLREYIHTYIQTRIVRGITRNLLEARAESNTETSAWNE